MNSLIKTIFTDFSVDGVTIPVTFLRYDGSETTYITYQQVNADDDFSSEDDLQAYMVYYDFDIYSKGNYLNIVEEVKEKMKENGFRFQPGLSSGDLYEDDTGYFHKTLNFSIIKYEGGN